MSDAIAFEFRGKTIGVLARSGDAFVFYSGAAPYYALDGALFAEPHDLHLALRRLEYEQRRALGQQRLEASRDNEQRVVRAAA